jgi:hypothetical protein
MTMTTTTRLRSALLLGAALSGMACDYLVTITGPTISNNNSNSNSNSNNLNVDIHDLLFFNPTPVPGEGGGTGGGTGGGGTETNPLAIPAGARSIAETVAASSATLILQSCQDVFGEPAWQFLDRVVAALKVSDARWGYVCRTPECGTLSRDVIGYRATADNTGLWGVDIIGNHCGVSPTFTWNVIGFDAALVWRAARH